MKRDLKNDLDLDSMAFCQFVLRGLARGIAEYRSLILHGRTR